MFMWEYVEQCVVGTAVMECMGDRDAVVSGKVGMSTVVSVVVRTVLVEATIPRTAV